MDLKQNKLYTYIGFAAKAGKIIYGDYAVEQYLKKLKIRLVILDHVSEATLAKYKELCSQQNSFLINVEGSMNELNVAGKANKIFGIRDKQFSELIINEYKNAALKAGVD